jgi:hypothetical protein
LQQLRQFWVSVVNLNYAKHQRIDELFECSVSFIRQASLNHAVHLDYVALMERDKDGPLVWKVLIHRPDTDPGSLGYPVGGDRGSAPTLEQFDGCIEHRFNSHLRPPLCRDASG